MRLFVAIPVSEDLRDHLRMFSSGVRGAKWVRPEGMHMTLRFIGECDQETARDIDAELDDIRLPGFSLAARRLGYFERGPRIHSIWAGFEGLEALLHLQSRVEAAVVRAGFPRESRKFTPHVTLARLKGGRPGDVGPWIEAHDLRHVPPFAADRFVLFRSHLAREGAMYEPLVEYALF
ncbi:MAG: RNA 2',3'-cyclic phosphodiesterase [Proteobacteria bacterium]|nr:RNA 2',3'-cyclic phosphodiesterase [Pseudomonadota bacterium]